MLIAYPDTVSKIRLVKGLAKAVFVLRKALKAKFGVTFNK
jgi:hypothetical protein